MTKVRTRIGIADIAVCLAAVILAVLLMLFPANSVGHTVHIKTASAEFAYDISVDRTEIIQSDGYELTVEIKNGAVRVAHSECPDKLCVKAGWVKDSSKPVICAPAKVLVSIDGSGGDSDADIIAGR